jgi:DNA-binding transcriptional regulator YdaS (Cro superfamily)
MEMQSKTNPHIERAIELVGGKQSALADILGCVQQNVSKKLRCEIEVTAEDALKIERATGGALRAADIRPDIFEPTREHAQTEAQAAQ